HRIPQRGDRAAAASRRRRAGLRAGRPQARTLWRAEKPPEAELMQTLRATLILTVFLTVTFLGIPWQASALRFGLKRRKTFPQRYHRFLCRLFGIRMRVVGTPVQGEGVLMVANHTSWLDILIFSAAARVSFVA